MGDRGLTVKATVIVEGGDQKDAIALLGGNHCSICSTMKLMEDILVNCEFLNTVMDGTNVLFMVVYSPSLNGDTLGWLSL